MGHLIFSDGHEIAFVDQDVGGLQHRVTEKPVRA